MTSVVVFDYGFGNVRSMVRALTNLDLDVTLTSDHRQALEADGLVVPGVGAFGACMEGLKSVGGGTVIKDRLRAGRPVLGVCVGEQIMFERGMEHGTGTPGLGLIQGDVELLDADVVPHMGWDTVEAPEGSVLMKGVENERFYFVHSFAAMSAAPADMSGDQLDFGDAEEHVTAVSWRPTSVVRCSPRSSTLKSPPKRGHSCCAIGWRHSDDMRSSSPVLMMTSIYIYIRLIHAYLMHILAIAM